MIELVASLLLLALPENSQYAQGSLPAGIARVIGAHAGIYRVRQFHETGQVPEELLVLADQERKGGRATDS